MPTESIGSRIENSVKTKESIQTPVVKDYGHQISSPAKDLILHNKASVKEALLRTIPVYGSVLGGKRIYKAWSTEDTPCLTRAYHSLVGGLELSGLGLLVLVFKVLATALKALFSKIGSLCSKIKQTNIKGYLDTCQKIIKKTTVKDILELMKAPCSFDLQSFFTRCFRLQNRFIDKGLAQE
ncbi:hypothetical protein [Candidatus Chlamydia corallus]|uniref:hypothetical protein n=1 Tax=Candidatus Chlamydia corallus TaxID=2038470 RepID=UPI000C2FDFDC|nr:hypothetical protein [Candidatus Chlamydia corallus]